MSTIAIRDGAIYLPSAVVDTYFRGIAAVIVLIQQEDLMVMPVGRAAVVTFHLGCVPELVAFAQQRRDEL